jgi:hypothetical protein
MAVSSTTALDQEDSKSSPDFAQEFLTYPDLFPSRHSGERWGDETMTIDFAGGPYRFDGLSSDQAQELREHYQDLVVCDGEAEPASTVTVFRVDDTDFRKFDLVGWHHRIDFDHTPFGVRFAGLSVMGSLDLSPAPTSSGSSNDSAHRGVDGALWTCEESGISMLGVFENFFRIVAAYRMLQLGGALLHSAAAVANGRAHLFLGHSGAGKTTTSRLSLERGYEVLSDDVNAVAFDDQGRLLVEKLPFAGELGFRGGRSERFPLAALYRLEQAGESEDHQLIAMSRAQTLALLLACAPFVNCDPFRQDQLIDVLQVIMTTVESHRMRFKKDPGFWELLIRND